MRRSLLSPLLSVFLMGECAGLLALLSFSAAGQQESNVVALPLKPKSVRFAAFGDNGTGGQEQYDVAQQMVRQRTKFPFDTVLMLGDNIYGSDTAADVLETRQGCGRVLGSLVASSGAGRPGRA